MSESGEDRQALGRQIQVVRGVTMMVADALALFGGPSAILTAATERAVTKRREEARATLERELASGDVRLEHKIIAQVDEAAAIVLRYIRAADEGTRLRNLRLMARAFRRQIEEDRADASSFQQTTASIEDLTDAELRLLGGWLSFGPEQQLFHYRESLGIPNEPEAIKPMYTAAAGLLRNGLVIPGSAWGGMAYELAPAARRLLDDLKAEDFEDTE